MRYPYPLALACLLAVLDSTTPALAQDHVTETEFLKALDGGQSATAALSDRLGAAQAEHARAGLWPNPVVEFEREAPHDAAEQTTWRIAWTPPFFDGRRGAAVGASRAGLQVATYDLEASRLKLRSDLRAAFADWALNAERQIVLDHHLELIQRLSSQMQSRARSGEESGLAARRLSLVALEVQAEAVQAEAKATLARAVALVWRPDLTDEASPERPDLPVVSDTAATPIRADLLARRSEVEEAEWELRAGRRVVQFPELSFGWQRIRDDVSETAGPVMGVSWPLPLFDRQQPEKAAASAHLSAARARLELATARARAELPAARVSYARLREAALLGLETAAQVDTVERSATATFRLGESRLTDLIETLRSALSVRLAALDLYAAALQAHRELELAAGRPLTSDGGSR